MTHSVEELEVGVSSLAIVVKGDFWSLFVGWLVGVKKCDKHFKNTDKKIRQKKTQNGKRAKTLKLKTNTYLEESQTYL